MRIMMHDEHSGPVAVRAHGTWSPSASRSGAGRVAVRAHGMWSPSASRSGAGRVAVRALPEASQIKLHSHR